ncbi:putative RNA-binding protein [Teratosphaeria destructans]|uniref:RNA-binding protein n=1 Tax=Teratosphaeria destructans TaxID=418781 RepID=A0A9W7SJM3_9PEZI|nr:putative RNA-binding protein [Teratosphaeria destructans]
MLQEELSRKDKKALRDAERHKKGKKRKHEETVEQVEAVDDKADLSKDFLPLETGEGDATETALASKKSKSKKRKQSNVQAEERIAPSQDETSAADSKSKKRRKVAKEPQTEGAEGADGAAGAGDAKKKDRFIVFVGNLPYDTTDASLAAHFTKIAPAAIRHRTDPKTKKSKGFAFLEFDGYDRMKTCLKLYHHSEFDPATYEGEKNAAGAQQGGRGKKAKGPRKINVELTAGGGGKTEGRREKIKAKNVRLEEQRQRRAELERKEKLKAEKKKAAAGGEERAKQEGPRAEAKSEGAAGDNAGMHPSRLARMQG